MSQFTRVHHSRMRSNAAAWAAWLTFSCWASFVWAGQSDEADHDALRSLKAVAEQAINQNQLELLKPHLAEDFWIVTYTDRRFTDFEEFKTRWQQTREQLLAGGSYTTQLLPEKSVILGDIALTRGNSENQLVTGDGANKNQHIRKTIGQFIGNFAARAGLSRR